MSTKHNNHVHGVFTGTVRCLQNTTIMSMVCLQEQSSVYKTQQDTVHGVFTGTVQCLQNTTDHVHGVFTGTVQCLQNTTIMSMVCLTGTVQCLQNTTIMSMVCLQEQSGVYKTQQSCPWCV